MTTIDPTIHTQAWVQGYATGNRRGHEDGQAELASRYTHDPSHNGHADEPPAEVADTEQDQWIDGFLTGYANGRDDTMRGAA